MLLAVILIFTSAVVAVHFMVVPLYANSGLNPLSVWYYIDMLMAFALIVTLVAQLQRKRAASMNDHHDDGNGGGLSRERLEANVMFYLSLIVALWFFRNWFDLLALLATNPTGSQSAHTLVIWDIMDPLLVIVVGLTGCQLWRSSAPSRDQAPSQTGDGSLAAGSKEGYG